MKTISVQQPWASLICAGIKDVENRTWKPKENPGRILIHASKKASKTILDKIPVEWASSILNNQTFGNIPYFEDMPSNAIIGYVDLVDIKEETDSLWDAGEGQLKWVLDNAYLFDEPMAENFHFEWYRGQSPVLLDTDTFDTSPFSQCCQ